MKKQPIFKNFISQIDRFLQAFDRRHPKLSLSQLQEVEKYRRISYLRDEANRPEKSSTIWEDF